jgi:hypothetical protein
MKKTKLLGLILFYSTIIFSQEIQLDIKNKHVNEFLKIEEKTGGIRLENKGTYHSYKPVEQPIIFEHKQHIIPNLITEYSFFIGDSLMESIKYNWKADKSMNVTDSVFIKTMISKYDSLDKYITSKLGKGTSEGNLEHLHLIDQRYGLEKTVKWFTPDSIEVRLYLTLSNYTNVEETAFAKITTETSHRIYLVVENQSKIPQSELKSDKELKAISDSFFNDLSKKDYSKTLTYFDSGFMSEPYTVSDLENLEKRIEPKKGMNFTTSMFMMSGEVDLYTFLVYKSGNGQHVKLLFNSATGKILAVE